MFDLRQRSKALAEAALARLTTLGDTPDAVADAFRAEGITGTHNAGTCPVAKFLHAGFPDGERAEFKVGVAGDLFCVSPHSEWQDLGWSPTPLPAPVSEFVRRFDDCTDYADLYRA